jgi:hypothetical protein
MSAGDLPVRIWIPYPHQNLGALERALGDLRGLSEVSTYLLAQDLASLPSFGPFRLPPSRDLVVAGSSDGSRVVVAASVFPLVARLARVAGRLADNPWLAGGSVELQGRDVQVEWLEGTWLASQGEVSAFEVQPVPDLAPSHALLSLEQPLGPVPKGLYRLDIEADGWRIVSVDSEARQSADSRPSVSLPRTLSLVAASTRSESGEDQVTRAFAMLSGAERANEQLTRSVVAQRGPGDRWRLPAERLLSGLGFDVAQGTHDGWTLAAYDEAALRAVTDELAAISDLLESVEGSPLQLGLWIDLGEARRGLDGLARALDALPLPASEQIRRWTVAARALAALDDFSSLTLRISGSPPDLELRVGNRHTD